MKSISVILITVLSFSFGCYYKPVDKIVNPEYFNKKMENQTVGIVIQNNLFAIEDEAISKVINRKYRSFENGFKQTFPEYLHNYSLAAKTYICIVDSTKFNDVSYYKGKMVGAATIRTPAPGVSVVDTSGQSPDLIMILKNIRLNKINGTYSPNGGGIAAHINIEGKVVLWDNKKGAVITFGIFSTNKNVGDVDIEDFDSCLKLLVQDVIYDSPLYDPAKAFTYDHLKK